MQNSQIKEKLSADIILFGKICFPNMFSTDSPPFHYEIAGLLEDMGNNKLNIIATPHIGGMTWEGQLKAYEWSINKL